MEKYFYLKDHLGNIRVTIDENGDVKGYNDYYPFGLRMPGRSMNNALAMDMYKYSSKELDEENGINWYYFGARYYDPMIGRWWSVDPLADKYISLSPYNYVENNPTNLFDPDGKGWERDFNNFVSTNKIKHAAKHNSAIMLANERYYFNKYGPTVLDGASLATTYLGFSVASIGLNVISTAWNLHKNNFDGIESMLMTVLQALSDRKFSLKLGIVQLMYDFLLSGEKNTLTYNKAKTKNFCIPDNTRVSNNLLKSVAKDLWITSLSPQEMWDSIHNDKQDENNNKNK